MKLKYLPHFIFTSLIVSQAFVVLLRVDIWPFSSYPMFSEKKSAHNSGSFRLKAVDNAGNSSIIYLPGGKSVWYSYRNLLDQKKYNELQFQMKEHFRWYVAAHQELGALQPVELQLVEVGVDHTMNGVTQFPEVVLHTVSMQ